MVRKMKGVKMFKSRAYWVRPFDLQRIAEYGVYFAFSGMTVHGYAIVNFMDDDRATTLRNSGVEVAEVDR